MPAPRYRPDELLAKYREIHDSVSPREFFTRPQHKKTQEFWCAAHFGRHYAHGLGPCHIHIEDHDEQSDADFELEAGGSVHPFQITEVQAPGRRRGDEYKKEASTTATLEDWSDGTENGPRWIREAIEKKLNRYGGRVSHLNLLVYLNFPAYDQQFHDIRETCAAVSSPFASVWLLNGNTAACIWSQTALSGPEGWLFGPESLVDDEL
jgi:hypothetical protein